LKDPVTDFIMGNGSWVSAVGMATDYRLDDRGVGVPSPDRVKIFLHIVHTGSGAHLVSCPLDTEGGLFPPPPCVKEPGRDAGRSPPTGTEVKKTWIYTFRPALHLHGMVFK
jgi:hypothetical protein